MSLKQFLAVGQSFVGIRPDKSPFAMRRGNQLPIFTVSPRFAPRRGPKQEPSPSLVQGELIDAVQRKEVEAVPVFTVSALEGNGPSPVQATKSSEAVGRMPARQTKRGLLFYLSFGVLGRKRGQTDLVQSELSLEQVRVIRNDLADADLELVMKKKRVQEVQKVQKPEIKPVRPIRSPEAPPRTTSSWNELTARLFEIGQH
ncbi:MAG TPA: hypothetical protein VGR78_06595 [Verrucomicrobiae bacterium]|jgi:hypothetical protein|nr:hypothetical protein [Verrucomicrobiae bacterium]